MYNMYVCTHLFISVPIYKTSINIPQQTLRKTLKFATFLICLEIVSIVSIPSHILLFISCLRTYIIYIHIPCTEGIITVFNVLLT